MKKRNKDLEYELECANRKISNSQENTSVAYFFLCVVSLLLVWALICGTDNIDMDNALGPMICRQDGRGFLRVETSHIWGNSVKEDDYIRIYCTGKINQTTRPIYDNSVYEVG